MTRDEKIAMYGEGPWVDEPDRAEWESHGLPCLMRRTPAGIWCGYVAVPPGHPLHGRDMSEVDVRVHGGLTYSERCNEKLGVCHVPKRGESDDVWWFGFDCNHGWDLAPGFMHPATAKMEYRDEQYVRLNVEGLARQLAAAREES